MMSTEPLSFGPEWLRNKSQEGCSQPSASIPRYQLAEHRYGREEMLALSGRLNPPPDSIKSIPSLYVEKAQVPLALIQMAEDETRQWNRGINSDAVLRVTGKAPVGGPPPSIRGGGRGGSVDRGRGRGRGGYYSRGLSFEEAGEGGELRGGPRPDRGDGPSMTASSFPRNIRPFDRSQSAIPTERGWSERNGTDPGDWNGSHSPRKEFGTGRSFMSDNWRRHRPGMEDEDGWRTATGGRTEKWTARNSWREGEKEGGDVDRGGRTPQWEQRTRGGWDDGHHPQRRPWDEDNLPEWATENPSESGGSFDATGAFHGGGFSDEDEINGGPASGRRDPRLRKMSEGSGVANIQKRPQVSLSKKVGVEVDSDSRKLLNEEQGRQAQNQNVERLESDTTIPKNSSSERDPPTNKQLPSSSLGVSVVSNAPSVHGHDRTNVVSAKQSGPNTAPSSNLVKSSAVDVRAKSGGGALSEPRVTRDAAKVSVSKQTVVSTSQSTSTTLPYRAFPPSMTSSAGSQKPEEAWDQMPEDADHLVEKLMADDDQQEKRKLSQKPAPESTQSPPNKHAQEKWYYRDPQGQEQGPFYSSDMAEWYKSGYFKPTLLIRRSCDEHFSHLGDLIESWGIVPFLAPLHFKPSEPTAGGLPTTQTAKPVPTLQPPIDPEAVLLEQYHFQMLQRQLMLSQQAAIQAAVHKLSQNDRWNTLSAIEQQQLIAQQVMSQPLDPYMNMIPGGLDQKNSISQLLSQLQQSKMVPPQLVENKLPPPMAAAPPQMPPLDPLQQMIQQMGGLQQPATSPIMPQPMPLPTLPGPPPVALGLPPMMHPAPTLPGDPAVKAATDPIQMLLRQLNASKPQVDSLWSGNAHPLFGNNLSWMPRVSPPPGQMPTSIWDIQGKEIKTEQEIMEEQRRAADERRLEELRKQEEERMRKEEEEQARLKREEEVQKEVERRKEEQRKRAEEEKRQQEKEAKRKEEERKKQEEEKKRLQEEEKKRKEEVKRLEEEARKQKEEAARRKEEEKKRKEEEKERKKKVEEERRKFEEQRKKEEEEQKRQEEEEAARKKAEEEQARQQRRQAEALRRLQEQQQQRAKASAWSQPAAPQPSLAEIQRQERDNKEREAKELQMQQMLAAQQAAIAAAAMQQAAVDKSSMHLNWVGKRPAVSKVKSLSEIQAEEHEKIVKNQERERAERAQQQKDIPLPAMSSIWGSASQSLSWQQNNSSVWSSTSPGSGGNITGNGGFWDDISLSVAKTAAPAAKTSSNKPAKAGATPNKSSGGGSKAKGSKKDEAVVMKLFEQNVQRTDDFTQWCTKTLTELHASCVEIPTFVAFLRDIESPYEVKDYIRTYLGDGKEILEFSRQFLERRSKWRSMQRTVQEEDDMCTPAPAINPLSTDFTEGKGKKTKKNKMFRVDNRILGFNVTAAEDRFNVGDRHYVEEL